MKMNLTEKRELAEKLNDDWSIEECIYNPMSGYNRSYDYAKFTSKVELTEDGKFRACIEMTIWHGDVEDNGNELACDKGETDIFAEQEFDGEEGIEEWFDSVELEYEGETETTYPGGCDHDDCDY